MRYVREGDAAKKGKVEEGETECVYYLIEGARLALVIAAHEDDATAGNRQEGTKKRWWKE